MIYGTTELKTQKGTTTITYLKMQEVVPIPYTDVNEIIEKGREATTITTTILTYAEVDKDAISALLHSAQKATLQVGKLLFKQVSSSQSFVVQNRTSDFQDYWLIGATFKALDPIPYNAETGDPLYA